MATTPHLAFADALSLYAELGAQGIGINEPARLKNQEDDLRAFRDSGLKASVCGLRFSRVLPSTIAPVPVDVDDRIQEMLRSLDEIAPFEPSCCVAGPGPIGSFDSDTAWRLAGAGLREVARYAATLGITIAIEPFHRSISADFHFVSNLPEAARLCDEIGEPNVGILFDVWHLWDTPDLAEDISANIDRIVGVQVDDVRLPARGVYDRVLPGDGDAGVREILAVLKEAGYSGWLDLEILSDDGSLGQALPDSLWLANPAEMVGDGLRKTRELWEGRIP